MSLISTNGIGKCRIQVHVGIVDNAGEAERATAIVASFRNTRISDKPASASFDRPVGIVGNKIEFVGAIRFVKQVQVNRVSQVGAAPQAVHAQLHVRRVFQVHINIGRRLAERHSNPSAQILHWSQDSILLVSLRIGEMDHHVVKLPFLLFGY